MAVETYGDSFPAQIGWHPWFNRNLGDGERGRTGRLRARLAGGARRRPPAHRPPDRPRSPAPGTTASGCPDGVDVTLTWPEQLELKVTSREEWVVVYDEQEAAVCVEPQTGPPNGLNTLPRLVTPIEPLEATTTWTWRRLGSSLRSSAAPS